MLLDRLIPAPRLLEVDDMYITAPPASVWLRLRHGELGTTPLTRALFAVRTLPERLQGKPVDSAVRVEDLRSSAERPGFQILGEDPAREFAVGAIGKVWQLEIPFVHVESAAAFAAFDEPGFVKVAWAIRVLPQGDQDSRVELELRVDATDEESWQKFKRYFRFIGPASRFVRRSLLASVARVLGTPEAAEHKQALPGDELLQDAAEQLTHGVTIEATPETIWPWLLQMGCRRAGFYALDVLDNAGVRSARELHPEFLSLSAGQVIPASPEGDDGFEVLRVEAPRVLILGGLYDPDHERQLPFTAPRPKRFWQVTWAFVLEPLDKQATRLHVRARAAFPESGRLHATWIRPVHHFMQTAMLRHLKQRAEGRLPRDDARDILSGIGGATIMLAALLSPFLRRARNHWGLDARAAQRSYPGDELVPAPHWGWTHAVDISAPAREVWPWVAQIGADRAGFYSYQWLENIVGCKVQNAERVHPEWEAKQGQPLLLHPNPKAPRLVVAAVVPGRYFVAHSPAHATAHEAKKPWASASWLFLVESLGEDRCRFVSRYRAASSNDLATQLAFGPTFIEPIGFAMDRRMLLGVKERAERSARAKGSRAVYVAGRLTAPAPKGPPPQNPESSGAHPI